MINGSSESVQVSLIYRHVINLSVFLTMTILCKPEVGMIIEANVIYVVNTKSQGSTQPSDLSGVSHGLEPNTNERQDFGRQ